MRASTLIACLWLSTPLVLGGCNPTTTMMGPCVPVELKSADIAGGKTLPAGSCYLVKSELNLSSGTLVVEPGVLFLFSTNIGFNVTADGRLKINGTAEAPVRFTGAETGVKWKGLRLDDSQGADNSWSYFELTDAGGRNWTGAAYSGAALYLEGATRVKADHLTIRGSASHGLIMFKDVTNELTNLTLVNNDSPAYVHPEVANQLPTDTVFEANVKPGVRVVFGNGDTVEGTHTWPAFTWRVENRFFVNGTLNLAPGATLGFAEGASLIVNAGGRLNAPGTAAAPITFTRSEAGLWKGIEVSSGSAGAPGATLSFCKLEYAGSANWSGNAESSAALYLQDASAAQVSDCTFSNNQRYAIWAGANAALPGFARNTFTNNGRVMILYPDRVGELGVGNTFTGNTLNGIHVVFGNGDRVNAPATWKNQGVPYLIRDRFFVEAALQLEAGVTLQFDSGAPLIVNASGSLAALGTAAAPVTFEGQTADDTGFWQGLRFASNVAANSLSHAVIRHAGAVRWTGAAESDASIYVDATTRLSLANTTIGPNGGHGVYLNASTSVLSCTSVTFTGNVKGPVYDNVANMVLQGC